uniref:Uncharacterized protein n=1 Tax=Candidatus Kentrum eta TaxID=2126337 RepID=A0A450V5G8_9GAMM|nr:MAG: hypothetical protein BECKH772A_GA0070896_101802 [Candidatus Kentron sp. H]VFK00317.1 MAG: hypothetical protein BECKH772B_GA0070898_101862 [Candidatus Kentron sp. H]VFK04539.1 MAG: hypothetical protein BECKH772C_GA0070978_101882 [Candidatus Kentron sp. H]
MKNLREWCILNSQNREARLYSLSTLPALLRAVNDRYSGNFKGNCIERNIRR